MTAGQAGLAGTYAAEKQYDKAIQVYNDPCGLSATARSRSTASSCNWVRRISARADPRTRGSRSKRVVDEFPDSLYAGAAKTELAQISAP